jgi:hypothetical protein
MKQFLFIMLWLTGMTVNAQRISHDFRDVSLSEALKYIQSQTTNYDLIFIYNELEDFRVTSHVQHQPVLDALMQIVGFYPVRIYKSGEREIYVECTHKTDRHLTVCFCRFQNSRIIPRRTDLCLRRKADTRNLPEDHPRLYPAQYRNPERLLLRRIPSHIRHIHTLP